MNPLNISAKFAVRSFTHSWDNRGYFKNLGSPWIRPRSLFSQIFQGLLFAWTLWIYLPNLTSVGLPIPEIIGGTSKILGVPGFAHVPHSPKFLKGFCSHGPYEYTWLDVFFGSDSACVSDSESSESDNRRSRTTPSTSESLTVDTSVSSMTAYTHYMHTLNSLLSWKQNIWLQNATIWHLQCATDRWIDRQMEMLMTIAIAALCYAALFWRYLLAKNRNLSQITPTLPVI